MLRTVIHALRDGVVTTRYPDASAPPPERFRGAPLPAAGRSFSDLPPASVCPTGAIALAAAAPGRPVAWTVDLGRCTFCGLCADAPPAGTVTLDHDFELSVRNRDELLVRVEPDAAGRVMVPAPDAAGGAAPGDRVAERIARTLGRSLHLRHLDAGSCNACDWELAALLAPHYDVRRLGIDFVASPRHADGVVVTGPVTRNLEPAVRRTLEAIPEPRVVIALGACACSGGIAGASYASAGGVDAVLPVDVYVPGCPPRPEAILFGILLAVSRIRPRRASRDSCAISRGRSRGSSGPS